MKTRKVPVRQCLGCREHFEKRELIRVVKSPEGEISLDFKGKSAGRGAYICQNINCLNKAIKSRAISRAFDMAIPEEIYEVLKKELEGKTD
ncbi:MAG: YlxR family protein [Clostridia bacterium]